MKSSMMLFKYILKGILGIGAIALCTFAIADLANLLFKDALILEGIILILMVAFAALGGNPIMGCTQGTSDTSEESINNCRCYLTNECGCSQSKID